MPIKFSFKPDNECKALVSPLNIFRSLILLLLKKRISQHSTRLYFFSFNEWPRRLEWEIFKKDLNRFFITFYVPGYFCPIPRGLLVSRAVSFNFLNRVYRAFTVDVRSKAKPDGAEIRSDAFWGTKALLWHKNLTGPVIKRRNLADRVMDSTREARDPGLKMARTRPSGIALKLNPPEMKVYEQRCQSVSR